MGGVTVDADVLYWVLREISKSAIEGSGPIETLIEKILDKWGIVLDVRIRTEWEQTCRGRWYSEWYLENLRQRRIREIDFPNNSGLRRVMRVRFGMPANSRDYKYVFCAKHHPPHFLLTEDIGIYDPRATSAAERDRAKNHMRGALCVYLKADHDITVAPIDLCESVLDL